MLKKSLGFLAMVLAVCVLGACGSKSKNGSEGENAVKVDGDSVLVVYYSQTGNTKKLAEMIQEELGAKIAEIKPVVPYDGDYDQTIERWKAEKDSNTVVEIKPLDVNLDDYHTIFLGFPIWGGTYALPVKTFLDNNSLKGKKVVTFATFGSGGLGSATDDVIKAQPGATVVKGYGVRDVRMDNAFEELNRFLIENNYKEGILETLGDYSEAEDCNQEAIEVFNAACADYKYPLGKPVKVAKRVTSKSTDYKFSVDNEGKDGVKGTSTIYVTVGKEEGSKPVFTEVVRH